MGLHKAITVNQEMSRESPFFWRKTHQKNESLREEVNDWTITILLLLYIFIYYISSEYDSAWSN